MGDHDELRLVGVALDVLGQTLHVDLVQGGLDLVEDAEGGGVDLQNGEEQSNADEGLLTTRELHEVLDDLSGRGGLDLDTGFQHVLGIRQGDLGRAASEQLGEGHGKVLVDLVEGIHEGGLHLALQAADDLHQLALGLLQIRELGAHGVVAVFGLVVFLHGIGVEVTDEAELVAAVGLGGHHLAAILGGHGGIVQGKGIGTGQLVVLPELARELVHLVLQTRQLAVGGGELAEQVLLAIHLLAEARIDGIQLLLVGGGVLVSAVTLGDQGGQSGLAFCESTAVLGLGLSGFRQLLAVGGHPLLVDGHVVVGGDHALLAESGQGLAGLHVLAGGGDLNEQAGLGGLQLIHAVLAVAPLVCLLLAEGTQLGERLLQPLLLGAEGGHGVLVGLVLTKDGLGVVTDAGQQSLVGVQIGAGTAELVGLTRHDDTGQIPLVLQRILIVVHPLDLLTEGVQLGLSVGDGGLQTLEVLLHALDLGGTGQSAVLAACGASRKGASHVDLLAVQGDHADAVFQRLGHGGGVVDVVEHQSSAQQRGQDSLISFVASNEGIGHGHKARKASGAAHVIGLQGGAHGRQGIEGGTARIGALQGVHGGLGGVLVLHHDVLEVGAQGGLHGGDVILLHRDQLGQGTVDLAAGGTVIPRDPSLPVGLHDELHRIGVALHLCLHGAVGIDALGDGVTTENGGVAALVQVAVLLVEGSQARLGGGDLLLNGPDLIGIFIHDPLMVVHFLLQGAGGSLQLLDLGQDPAVAVAVGIAGGLQHRQADPQIHELLLAVADIGGGGVDEVAQLLNTTVQIGDLLVVGGGLLLQSLQSLPQAFALGAMGLQLGGIGLQLTGQGSAGISGGRDHFLGVAHGGLGDAVAAVQAVLGLGEGGDLTQQLLGCGAASLGHFGQSLPLDVQRLYSLLGLIQVKGRMIAQSGGLGDIVAEALGVVEPQADVRPLLGLQQHDTLAGLVGFLFQRNELGLHLGKDIPYADEIILGGLQLALGLILLDAVLGDTRGILEYASSLLALTGDHVGDTALSNDGVAVAADTRIEEQLVNILQADGLTVDQIFTFPRAKIAAGDGDLVVGAIQLAEIRGVVEGHGDLGIAHGSSAVGAAEDDVLHLTASQGLGGDLTQHPAHGVCDVGFTASVGADDYGHADGGAVCHHLIRPLMTGIEYQLGAIGKGLEALHFN